MTKLENKSIYSFLWSAMKLYKWHYAVMLIAPIVGAFYEFSNNYCLKLVVDAFTEENRSLHHDLLYAIVLFISAQIVLSIVWRVSNIAEWKAEPNVRRIIILQSYDYVQHHSYQFFQENYTGSIISKLKGIIDGYDNFWAHLHHRLTPKAMSTVVLTAALAMVNIDVFVFMAFWCSLFVVIMYRMSLKLDRISFTETGSRHAIFGLLSDNVANIFSLFSFATRKRELKRVGELISNDFIPKQMNTYKYNFKLSIIADVLYMLMLVFVFIFMVYLRQVGKISSGDFVFVMTITLSMSWHLWELIMQMQDFIKQMGDFKSSFEILKHSQEVIDKPNAALLKIKSPGIKFEDVSFSYDKNKRVFSGLNINIKSGEKVGIVGLSGAGKSTLVSILLKYFPINKGNIVIDSQDIKDVTSDSLRAAIALIPQDIMLFHRTIKENIRYGNLDATDAEIIAAAKLANIHELIESLPDKYDTLVGERGIKLSGGQRQRIAIARAILKNAPILILDEATSSLDTETEKLIQRSINAMLENKNTTVIAIAHRLSTLKHLDRIIVLKGGKVVEEGKHNDLIRTSGSLYKKLWDMQKI